MRQYAALLCASLYGGVHLINTLLNPAHYPATRALRATLAREEARLQATQSRIAELQGLRAALKTPLGQEQAVRDELGWVRPGEILITFRDAPAPMLASADR